MTGAAVCTSRLNNRKLRLMNDRKSLSDLQRTIRQFCDDRDWDQFHNPKDLSISLTLEASELLEHFQWKTEDEIAAYLKERKSEVGDELADVFYWVLLMANKLDVDLVNAFDKKMLHNEAKYPVDKSKGSAKKYTELS